MSEAKSKAQKTLALKSLDKRKQDWLKKVISIHGDLYDYSAVEYDTSKTPVKIKCKVHGFFKMQPRHHAIGQNCPDCKHDERGFNQRKDLSTLEEQSKKKYGDRFSFKKSNYVWNRQPIIITCREHGDFETTPHNHLDNRKSQSGGCPKCKVSSSFSKKDEAIFYIFRFKNTDIFKIGVSNRTLEQRYSKSFIKNTTYIRAYSFSTGLEALKLESFLKSKLKKYKFLPESDMMSGFSGNTELFKGLKFILEINKELCKYKETLRKGVS